jgi:hypothetical protein
MLPGINVPDGLNPCNNDPDALHDARGKLSMVVQGKVRNQILG